MRVPRGWMPDDSILGLRRAASRHQRESILMTIVCRKHMPLILAFRHFGSNMSDFDILLMREAQTDFRFIPDAAGRALNRSSEIDFV